MSTTPFPSTHPTPSGDIAIVGMSCLFPGAADLHTFWQNIVGKICAIGDPPPDRDIDRFYDPTSTENDRIYCRRGGYLGDLATFDPIPFGIMPVAVEGAEPEHFMALKLAMEALTDAGYPDIPINKERTEVLLGRGTFANRGYTTVFQHSIALDQTVRMLGQLHPEYTTGELEAIKQELKAALPPFNSETAQGLAHSVMAGIVANRLDLQGRTLVLDAACASSLLAIEIGMQDLRNDRCDAVIAGGVQISTPAVVHMLFTQLGALSRQPTLRPFDENADGTMLGEGMGMVLLKRREDAERDGNRIYALVKAVGSASDGRAKGLLAPRVEGEMLALRRAYEHSGINPDTIELIEAHGTSLPLGDQTEIAALHAVFGSADGLPRCAVGTIKSMIGHLIPAAGIAGIIKTALSVYHQVYPPTLNLDRPNPKLGVNETALYFNTETRPWIHGLAESPRRAGVNAFGFGGINAHAILEESNPSCAPRESFERRWDSELVLFHGSNREELILCIETVVSYLDRHGDTASLVDIAYSLRFDSTDRSQRLAVVATSPPDLLQKLQRALTRLRDAACRRIKERGGVYFFEEQLARDGKVAFLYPGEGSQYPNMLIDLARHFPEVRECFDVLDRAYVDHPRGYLPSQLIFPPPAGSGHERPDDEDGLWQMDIAVDAVITADRALHRVLDRLGVTPHVVLGHSSGELMAVEASGAVHLEDDEELIGHIREGNRVIQQLAASEGIPEGVLTAVGAARREEVLDLVAQSNGRLHLAMDNCPNQFVICGDTQTTESACNALRKRGAICQRLAFNRPYHTAWFSGATAPLQDFVGRVRNHPPKVDLYSCVTAAPMGRDVEEIRRLVVEQWSSRVRFRETIEAMYAAGVRLFVEVGPNNNLTGFVGDILNDKDALAIPVNSQRRSGITQLHHALALMVAHGVAVQTRYLYQRRAPQTVDFHQIGEGSPKPTRERPIQLGLPMLEFKEGAASAHRPRAEATSPPPSPAPTATPRSPEMTSLDSGARAAAVTEYLDTMGQFMNAQHEVMEAYIQRRGRRPAAGTRHASRTVYRWLAPGHDLQATRVLDPSIDTFIAHHTLGGRVSRDDTELMALPVIPVQISLAFMAEAAAQIEPDKHLTAMRDIDVLDWVVWGSQGLELRMQATRVDDAEPGTVQVQLHAVAPGSGPAEDPVRLQATFVFAEDYPTAPSGFELDPALATPTHIDQSRIYPRILFHGPAFRALSQIDRLGRGGVEAGMRVPPPGLLSQDAQACWLGAPVLLDGAGQLVGLWAEQMLPEDFVIFPHHIDAIRFYAPAPGPSDALVGRMRITQVEQDRIGADAVLTDTLGRILIGIEGLVHRRTSLPRLYHDFRGSREIRLTEPEPGARADGSITRRILPGVTDVCRLDGGIWRDVLAWISLTRAERTAWERLDCPGQERSLWLEVRLAAKDAVRDLLAERAGVDVWPADIEIDDRGSGVNARGGWGHRMEQPIQLTWEPENGRAAALAPDGVPAMSRADAPATQATGPEPAERGRTDDERGVRTGNH